MVQQANKKQQLNAQLSGTTCTMVLHDFVAQRLYVAHVGDSRAVIIRKEGDSVVSQDLTIDHKPELVAERAYIEANGGRVAFDGFANHRVYVKDGTYPGLNMSRALGDLLGSQHAGINNEPDVAVFDLTKESGALFDNSPVRYVLLVCSDGVWEFISSEQARDIVMRFPNKKFAKECAEALAKVAWDRWIREEGGVVVDDITAMTVYIS